MKAINSREAPLKGGRKRQSNIIYSISIKELLLTQEASVSIVNVHFFHHLCLRILIAYFLVKSNIYIDWATSFACWEFLALSQFTSTVV